MKQYDSSELMDIHSIAECDLNWGCAAIQDVKLELKKIETNLKSGAKISEYDLKFVLEKISMYEYLLGDRRNYHDIQKEAFEKEMGE